MWLPVTFWRTIIAAPGVDNSAGKHQTSPPCAHVTVFINTYAQFIHHQKIQGISGTDRITRASEQ